MSDYPGAVELMEWPKEHVHAYLRVSCKLHLAEQEADRLKLELADAVEVIDGLKTEAGVAAFLVSMGLPLPEEVDAMRDELVIMRGADLTLRAIEEFIPRVDSDRDYVETVRNFLAGLIRGGGQ